MNTDEQLKKLWQELSKDGGTLDFTERFTSYCSSILSLADKGSISRPLAAEYIAGTMFLDAVDKRPELESLAFLAGELEVPEDQFSGDYDVRWQELVAAVGDLGTDETAVP